MPLIKSPSKKAFQHNVKAEMEAHPDNRAQDLAIAYSVKRQAAKKRKKMAEGGILRAEDAEPMLHDEEMHEMTSMHPMSPKMQPPKAMDEVGAKKRGAAPDMTKPHTTRKAYFEGGVVSQKASEEDMEEHPAGLESDNDQMRPKGYMDEQDPAMYAKGGSVADQIRMRKKYADGGMVDLDENAMEQPNGYYSRNEDAALKENYDQDIHSAMDPMDSAEHGDSREMDSENEDDMDMISSIRRKMKSRM